MKNIHKSFICAVITSMVISLNACADEGSGSSSKSASTEGDMASMQTIVGNLKSVGFTSINKLNYANGSYEVNGIANGMFTTAYVEPHSGDVIQEKNYASLKNIESIQKLVNNLQQKYYHIIYSIKLNPEQTEYEVTAKNSQANKISLTVDKNGEITSN